MIIYILFSFLIKIFLSAPSILFTSKNVSQSLIKPQPVNIESPALNANCPCDLTSNFCNKFCCCDPDCLGSFSLTLWGSLDKCIAESPPPYEKYFSNCGDTNKIAKIDDLYSPIRVFYQNIRKGFCVMTSNTNFTANEETEVSPSNSTEFTEMISKFKKVSHPADASWYYDSAVLRATLTGSMKSNFEFKYYTGYKPADPLRMGNGTDLNILNLPSTNPYGLCQQNSDATRFLINRDYTCAIKYLFESVGCSRHNSDIFEFDLPLLVYHSNNTDKLYYTERSSTSKLSAFVNNFNNFGNTFCQCTDAVTRVRQDFLMENETIVEYKLTYFLEDVTSKCDQNAFIPVNYVVNYVSKEEYPLTRSGNPGYIKGRPLITGTSKTFEKLNTLRGINETIEYVERHKFPRVIQGVAHISNKGGQCYYKTPLAAVDNIYSISTVPSLPTFTTDLVANANANFYDDTLINNVLTFEDKIQWGCVDKLNATGLQIYCEKQLWKEKLLFNFTNNINFFAKFGNPDENYILDWIKVQQLNLDAYQSFWDSENKKCTIPAIFSIDILYAKTGMVNNTQNSIVDVKYRLDNTFWWVKEQSNNELRTYNTYININYHKIPLKTKWWFAPGPGFIKFPRNIFYPFRVGTTTYNIQNSSHLVGINYLSLLLVIFFI